jgi:hypothetical protein
MQIDETSEEVGADLYTVRTYNAQQLNVRNRANPTQPNQAQNARRQTNADRKSYAQPLHAEVEQPPTGNNSGPAPQPQPRQSKQANTQKSESRQQKHAKEEDDD